ncbi:hypothetical protein HPB47_004902, partial [Ixodes persulcatus]
MEVDRLLGDDVPYVIQNVDANSAPTVAETEAGVGMAECPMDYVLLGGVRYCGTRLNPDAGATNPSVNAPVVEVGTSTLRSAECYPNAAASVLPRFARQRSASDTAWRYRPLSVK